jgi:hypothetical protein
MQEPCKNAWIARLFGRRELKFRLVIHNKKAYK